MASFINEWKSVLLSPFLLILWVGITLILTLSGPFGSYQSISFAMRLLFWGGTCAAAIVIGKGCCVFVSQVLHVAQFRVAALMVAGMLSLLLGLPLHYLAIWQFHGPVELLPSLLESTLFVFFSTLGVSAFSYSVRNQSSFADGADPLTAEAQIPVPAEEDSLSTLPRLVMRLNPELRGALQSIAVRDHYVDVTTSSGQGSVLMRFSDAVAEAEPVQGVQVHRSYWVALDAISMVERGSGKVWVVTEKGLRLPVSRNHRSKLEALGFL